MTTNFSSRLWDLECVKNQDPGSGINIPDPQHCPAVWTRSLCPLLNVVMSDCLSSRSVRYRNEQKFWCRNQSGTRIRGPSLVPEYGDPVRYRNALLPCWRHRPQCWCPALQNCEETEQPSCGDALQLRIKAITFRYLWRIGEKCALEQAAACQDEDYGGQEWKCEIPEGHTISKEDQQGPPDIAWDKWEGDLRERRNMDLSQENRAKTMKWLLVWQRE